MDFDTKAFQEAVTAFGNLAVVGPAAVVAWLWLLRRRGFWAAWQFQWPVAVTFFLVVGLKMVSHDAGPSFVGTPIMLSEGAPSGHMAMSTVVYAGLALMLLRRGVEPIGLLMAMLVAISLIGIAITRVTLHAHTPADVVAGFIIGGACAIWAGWVSRVPEREPVRHVAELVLIILGTVLVMHLSGLRFDSATVI